MTDTSRQDFEVWKFYPATQQHFGMWQLENCFGTLEFANRFAGDIKDEGGRAEVRQKVRKHG